MRGHRRAGGGFSKAMVGGKEKFANRCRCRVAVWWTRLACELFVRGCYVMTLTLIAKVRQ